MIRGVVFDLDGVLIESEPMYIKSEIEVFSKYNIPLTVEIASEYLGLKLEEYIRAIEQRFNKKVDVKETAEKITGKIKQMYEKGEIPLVPNALEVLAELQKSYKLALATSREKHLAQMIMKKYAIDKYFGAAVYKEDVKNGKPNPEVFLKATGLIGVPPQNCAVVEDAVNGVKSGKAAQMYVIARKVDYNKNSDLSAADDVIIDLEELPAKLAMLK